MYYSVLYYYTGSVRGPVTAGQLWPCDEGPNASCGLVTRAPMPVVAGLVVTNGGVTGEGLTLARSPVMCVGLK